MVAMEERESLLRSLKGYLEDLVESGVDELTFAESHLPSPSARATATDSDLTSPSATAAGADIPSPSGRGAGVRVAPDAAPAAAALQQRPRVDPHSDEAFPEPAAGPGCRVEGNPRARLFLVAEGAGFSGAAGELLEKIIVAMRYSREEVCLISFAASPDAADSLATVVAERVASAAPEVVVTLGEAATRMLVKDDKPLEQLRGRFHVFRGIPTMPSFHPDAMLADETLKRDVWKDMQQVMRRLEQAR